MSKYRLELRTSNLPGLVSTGKMFPNEGGGKLVTNLIILRWISGRSSALQADETGSIPVRSAKQYAWLTREVRDRSYTADYTGSSPVPGTKFYSTGAAGCGSGLLIRVERLARFEP